MIKILKWSLELKNLADKIDKMKVESEGHQEKKDGLVEDLRDNSNRLQTDAQRMIDFWSKKQPDIQNTIEKIEKGEPLTSYDLNSMENYWGMLKGFGPDIVARMPILQNLLGDISAERANYQKIIAKNQTLFNVGRQIGDTRDLLNKYRKEIEDTQITPQRLREMDQILVLRIRNLENQQIPQQLSQDKAKFVSEMSNFRDLIEKKLNPPPRVSDTGLKGTASL